MVVRFHLGAQQIAIEMPNNLLESNPRPELKKPPPDRSKNLLWKKTVGTVLRGTAAVLTIAGVTMWLDKDLRDDVILTSGQAVMHNPGLRHSLWTMAANGINAAISLDQQLFPSPEGTKSLRNPDCRPVSQQIIEAILNYELQHGKKVTYRRSPDYRDDTYYDNVLENILASPEFKSPNETSWQMLGYDMFFLYDELEKAMPGEAKEMYESSHNAIWAFRDVAYAGSGFKARLELAAGQPLPDMNLRGLADKVPAAVNEKAKQLIHEARSFVEHSVAENGGRPISASKILEYFLEKNGGSLDQSLWDTTIFLKFSARNDPETAEYIDGLPFTAVEKITGWMSNNILDEYGELGNWRTLPDTDQPSTGILGRIGTFSTDRDLVLSKRNIQGEAYHNWNKWAMKAAFPDTEIEIGFVGRYLSSYGYHGPLKFSTDLSGLSEDTLWLDERITR
jgi:hypothetical protein